MKNAIHRNCIISNEETLRWALKPGVSVAFDPARWQRKADVWSNFRYGLFMISEIYKLTEGWLTFVSGNDCLRVYSNNVRSYSVGYRGRTLVIRIRTSKIKKCQSIIDQDRENGETAHKTIKIAFKEASIPSKGLLR